MVLLHYSLPDIPLRAAVVTDARESQQQWLRSSTDAGVPHRDRLGVVCCFCDALSRLQSSKARLTIATVELQVPRIRFLRVRV